MSLAQLKQREEALLCRTYSRYPVSVARGKGARLWDVDGNEYIDLLAGIAVVGLGHGNEELADVMAEQARKFVHVSNLFYQEEQLEFAEKLLATSHAGKAFFCNSGAEANEAAFKLARRYQRKIKNRDAFEIICLENCFHGRTLAALAATGKYYDGFEPLPQGFKHVPWGDLSALAAAITPQTAAIHVEFIQGEGGVYPLTPEYARGVHDLCRKHDILFMADEVQAGMGRSGKFWSFQHYDLLPDVFTSAKALANGLPLGAMLCTNEVAQGFDYGSHATTFGGGALVSAVGSKVLDIMQRDNLVERADTIGTRARARFRDIAQRLPGSISDVRGKGLLIGVELALDPTTCAAIKDKLLQRRFLFSLTHGNVIRLIPPLIIDEADIIAFADALEEVLKGL